MTMEVKISVKNVSKKFCRSLRKSLSYGIRDICTHLLGLYPKDKLRKKEFWVFDDISFEVKAGECLGILGTNGTGKSTILKMINGLILPDKGIIVTKGKVGALIELGAGFNPLLTGRENVWVNGAILGMKSKEIKQKFAKIEEFAEIGEAIDMPVQNYSSGMCVKLGFAIAAQLEPDIMLIDEVLAVGDAKFRNKCFAAMLELKRKGTAFILISHNTDDMLKIVDRVIEIRKGKVVESNSVQEGLNNYRMFNS